jgi:gluconokinase
MARAASGWGEPVPPVQATGRAMRPRVVVMGVSGCGKTTVGQALAGLLGVPYVDGDDLHSPENVARMAAGVPLDDDARAGWLDRVGARLAAAGEDGVVVSCSALKRSYRDRLRAAEPGLTLVFLHGEPALIAARLASRQGHYMPPSLLQSQLDTLEPPRADEGPLHADIAEAPTQIAARLAHQLQQVNA